MKLKKTMVLGLACAMVLSTPVTALAAVKGANEDPANTEKTEETLRIALASEPSTLWPAGAGKTENEAQIISSALMDTLVAKDKVTGEVIPNLASEWEWVDATHCKFTLRDDVVMSDGTPLVADDVVYDVNEIWIALNASNDTGRFLKGAAADDEHTVTLEFTTAAPDLLEMLSMTNFGVVSKDEVEAAGGLEAAAKAPNVGSGKYKFVEWNSGQSITLTRNEDYWNQDYAGYFKDIVFTFTNDAAAREMAVESGDIDVAYEIPVIQAATFAENESVQTIIYKFGQVAHLWYNMTDEHATSDAKLRQAIDLALDFDALNQVGTAGYGETALGYFVSDSKYYNETYTAEERAVDLEKAKSLLEEAGYADGLELSILGMQDTAPIYTVIQENLRAIGINLTINTVDTAQFVESAFGGNYDLIMVGEYTAARYPTLFCFLDKETIESGFIIGGPKVTTDEIDAKITEVIEDTDEASAKTKAGEFEQMLKDETIVSNLFSEMKASIINKDLKGYTTQERGFLDPTGFYK
ncbi:ABC transporter substrate-binding protein [Murimonas intestini]|uniref:ABC transporter substrate-binding protein n=1 Tax=Murimonas intestini TaxID=1337051 RepID=UPI0011DCD661|nr:ABC transporter substrate-binding protein [Murimonas intestini]